MIVEKLREIENEGSLDEAGWEEFQQELELTDSALDLAKVGVGAIHYVQSLPPSTLFLSPIPSCLPHPTYRSSRLLRSGLAPPAPFFFVLTLTSAHASSAWLSGGEQELRHNRHQAAPAGSRVLA